MWIGKDGKVSIGRKFSHVNLLTELVLELNGVFQNVNPLNGFLMLRPKVFSS